VIVADASVVVAALLLRNSDGDTARAALLRDEAHAPHRLDVEVTSAIRRGVLGSRIPAPDARALLGDLRDLAITRHAHEPLLDRVLELRDSVSAYDGSYVALAELLDATLVTADARLARASDPRCRMQLLPAA
jgi:predicted nucleic acid-binding protein